MHETILHRNIRNRRKRCLCFVFSYDFSAPSLADDLGAVQSVDVVGSVHDLVGTDTVGVIHELQEGLPAVAAHLLELTAVPVLPLPAEQNALRVAR